MDGDLNFHQINRYKYNYPFLETNGIVSVDDNSVGSLYKHVFPPVLAPGLSFVGIPQKVHLCTYTSTLSNSLLDACLNVSMINYE